LLFENLLLRFQVLKFPYWQWSADDLVYNNDHGSQISFFGKIER